MADGRRKRVGLALGGGVVRGIAHLGVISVLEEAGIPIDCISGTSVGAIIAAGYAAGIGVQRLSEYAQEFRWWRIARPLREHWLLSFELVTAGEILRRGTPWYTRHDPGDWSLSLSQIRPGEIVEDFYPARLSGLPPGDCEVRVLVLDPARPAGRRILGKVQVLGIVRIQQKG